TGNSREYKRFTSSSIRRPPRGNRAGLTVVVERLARREADSGRRGESDGAVGLRAGGALAGDRDVRPRDVALPQLRMDPRQRPWIAQQPRFLFGGQRDEPPRHGVLSEEGALAT